MANTPDFPPGNYAIVELLGHTTLVGRVDEVEMFGTKMLAIEVLFQGNLLPAVFHGGASIYRFTPCSAEAAFDNQPKHDWQLPPAVRCIVPPLLLEVADQKSIEADEDTEDEEDNLWI